MKSQLLTVRDVMKILKVSRRTIYYWIKDGIVHPIKLGSAWRFHPEDIDAFTRARDGAPAEPGKRILVVDDDLLVRRSLKSILEREGFNVTVSERGQDAVDFLAAETVDLILTDIRMPGMNGIETLKKLRAVQRETGRPHVPEIILTAYDDPEIKREAETLGVHSFILKPFDLGRFLEILRSALSSSQPVSAT